MTNRLTLALALIALAAVGFEVYKYLNGPAREQQLPENYRIPVANPPIEPTRPDVNEESGIDG